MKRIVAYIIALALFAAAFAGCSAPVDEPAPTAEPGNEPTETVEPSAEPVVDNTQALENAAAYIKLMYKKSAVKTPADYQVVGFAVVDGVSYQIQWTVEITGGAEDAVVVGELGEDKMVTIDVNEACAEDYRHHSGRKRRFRFRKLCPHGTQGIRSWHRQL